MRRWWLVSVALGCADPDVVPVADDDLVQLCPQAIAVREGLPGERGQLQVRLRGRGEIEGLRWTPGVGSRLGLDPIGAQADGQTFEGCPYLTVPYQFRASPVVPSGEGISFIASPGGWLEVNFRSGQPSVRTEVVVVGADDTGLGDAGSLGACAADWSCP